MLAERDAAPGTMRVFGKLLSWLMLLGGATSSKDIELTRTGPVTEHATTRDHAWSGLPDAVLAALIRQLTERRRGYRWISRGAMHAGSRLLPRRLRGQAAQALRPSWLSRASQWSRFSPRCSRANCFAERLVLTVRNEQAPSPMLIFGERHLRRVLTDYTAQYNMPRPRRALQWHPRARDRLSRSWYLTGSGSTGPRWTDQRIRSGSLKPRIRYYGCVQESDTARLARRDHHLHRLSA